jgi:hypothetical protein
VLMVLASTKVSLMSRRDFFYDGGLAALSLVEARFDIVFRRKKVDRFCCLMKESRKSRERSRFQEVQQVTLSLGSHDCLRPEPIFACEIPVWSRLPSRTSASGSPAFLRNGPNVHRDELRAAIRPSIFHNPKQKRNHRSDGSGISTYFLYFLRFFLFSSNL